VLADLSPEEQSFFDAGEALEPPLQDQPGALRRHRSRRRSRHHWSRDFRRNLRRSGWLKLSISLVLMVAAVGVGYWASMFVVNRDVPSPSDYGVESRGR
jgi:hypothetical protein